MSASFASFEQCLEVTDYKKSDTGNVLPKSMEHFFAMFENHEVKAFFRKPKDSWKFDLELVSPKSMSANAESVRIKLACNVHVWAFFFFEKLALSGRT